jgi:adenylyl-sulfate kinase
MRAPQNNFFGCILWFTGFSGAGKSTVAEELRRQLIAKGQPTYVLDGDVMRRGLCSDLKFSPVDRKENMRRVGEVARLFADAGVICIVALISPYVAERALARKAAHPARFVEVFINAPLEVCEQRDVKGLYARARKGELKDFTGISAPYEPPQQPEIELRTDQTNVAECVAKILSHLNGYASSK